MGTHGDLGNTLKWKPPFPDMTEIFKTHTKKAINDAVALINARKPQVFHRKLAPTLTVYTQPGGRRSST